MARSLKFGRLPAKAPDLTATIMGMIREYENARDRNIVSAWNDGGEFEGKPVTDQRLLDHFDQRIEDTDPGDPMYDYWRQTKWQYQFNIAEQKVGLAYAQGKMTEGGMARFYRTWAGKVPKHSAVYRDLMLSATKFGQATRSGGQASGAASHAQAVANQISDIYAQEVAPVRAARTYLDQFLALHFGGTTNMGNLNVTQALMFDELLAHTAETNQDVYDQMKRAMRDVGIGGGPLNINDVIRAMDKASSGLRKVIRIKKREGYSTTDDENSIADLKKGKKSLLTVAKDIPDQVEAIERDLAEALAENEGDPVARIKARQEASADLLALSKRTPDAGISGSLYQQHLTLLGETATGTTVRQDYSQTKGNDGDAAITPEDALAAAEAGEPAQVSEMESQGASALADIRAAKGLADGSLVRVSLFDAQGNISGYDYVDPRSLGTVGLKPVQGTSVTLMGADGKPGETIPAAVITHAAVSVRVGAVMVASDEFGRPINEEQAASSPTLYWMQTFGEGDVQYVERTTNPDGSTSTSYSNESPLQMGSDGKPLPMTYTEVDGIYQWVAQITPERVAQLSGHSTSVVNGQVVYNPNNIDMPPDPRLDPNVLLDPEQRDITDVLGVGKAVQGGTAASGQTYRMDASGKPVLNTAEATDDEALSWLPDSFSIPDPNNMGRPDTVIKRTEGESRADWLTRLGKRSGNGTYDGNSHGYRKRLNDFLTKYGVTPPADFVEKGTTNKVVPEGQVATGGGTTTPPTIGVNSSGAPVGTGVAAPKTGVASTYSMLDFLRGANPAAAAWAAASGSKQPNLTNVMTWSSTITRVAAKNPQTAAQYAAMDRVELFDQAVKEHPSLASDVNAQQRWFMEFDSIDQIAQSGSDRAFQSALARLKQPAFNTFLGGSLRDAFETPQEKARRLGLTTAEQLAEAGRLGAAGRTGMDVLATEQRARDRMAQVAKDNDGSEDGPSMPPGAGVGVPGTLGSAGAAPGIPTNVPGMLGTGYLPRADLGGIVDPVTNTELQGIFDPNRNQYAPRGSIPQVDVRSGIGGQQPKPNVTPDPPPYIRSNVARPTVIKTPEVKVPKAKPIVPTTYGGDYKGPSVKPKAVAVTPTTSSWGTGATAGWGTGVTTSTLPKQTQRSRNTGAF